MEVRRNPPSKCIYRKHVLDGARYVTQVTRNRGFSPPVEERRPDERARWWIVSEGIHATRLCNACFRDDHGSSSPKEPALSPPKIESYEFSTFHHFRRPSKTQFRETRDFTTGSHSRRIFRNCTFVPSNSSDLFELFVRPLSLFDRLSEIGQYRSLKEKASLKASFFERAIFFLCDLKYLRYIYYEILFKRIWQIQGSMEDFRQLVEKSIEIVKIKLVRYTRFNSFCLGKTRSPSKQQRMGNGEGGMEER